MRVSWGIAQASYPRARQISNAGVLSPLLLVPFFFPKKGEGGKTPHTLHPLDKILYLVIQYN